MECQTCGEKRYLRYRCTGELLCHDCWGDAAWNLRKKGQFCELCGIVGDWSCLRTYKKQRLCLDCWQSSQEYGDSPWDAGSVSSLEPDQQAVMRRPSASSSQVECPEFCCDHCGRDIGRLQDKDSLMAWDGLRDFTGSLEIHQAILKPSSYPDPEACVRSTFGFWQARRRTVALQNVHREKLRSL